MTKISVLDQNTINQIAAGEVVERPCSVVKELIENAIDAGASAVTAELKEGGLSFIRITDNGSGIEKDEVPLAFLQHSTSKIKTVEDLLTIGSLGFRGEALSSIASVAQVELITKTRTAFTGIRYLIDGGEEKGNFEIGCPEGTTFLIRNLFFNTPARRKFLKSPMTEAGYISDLMERLAVSHPEISFKYINNNKTMLHTSGNGNLKDIIYHVYGRDISSQLLEIQESMEHVTIDGYIGKPIISRGNRNYENYFINGRYIKSSIISKAIEEAYKPYSMQHKYPFTVLNFQIEPSLIDVNVHPTKMEIRFSDGESIYQAVFHAVRNTLSGKNMIPDVKLSESEKEPARIYGDSSEPFEKKRIKQKSLAEIRIQTEQKREQEIGEMKRSPFMENSVNVPFTPLIGKLPEGNVLSPEERYMGASIGLKNTPFIMEPKQTKQNNQNIFLADIYNNLSDSNLVVSEESITPVKQLSLFEENKSPASKKYLIIGQLFSTYWLLEYEQQLYMIDQHAAHEKVLYEKTMAKINEKEFLSQIISPPIVLTLSAREEEAVKHHMEVLTKLGFTIEAFGGNEYSVSSLPADMFGINGKDLLIEFIDDLVDGTSNSTPDIVLEKVASMSCKAAVKGSSSMSYKEAEALITQLMTLENPFFCPHGRPVIISMTKYEIEKKFKRII